MIKKKKDTIQSPVFEWEREDGIQWRNEVVGLRLGCDGSAFEGGKVSGKMSW